MTWPFRSALAIKLEAQLDAERTRTRELQATLVQVLEREKYWRERYERVADAMLFRTGDINAPLHVDPKPTKVDTLGAAVSRVSNLVGSSRGISFDKVTRAD